MPVGVRSHFSDLHFPWDGATVPDVNERNCLTMNYTHLFQPGQIGSLSLKNRILMPLYPTKYATESRVNERMIAFYRERAKGGAALIVLDCPCLDYPAAYKGKNELRMDEPSFVEDINRGHK